MNRNGLTTGASREERPPTSARKLDAEAMTRWRDLVITMPVDKEFRRRLVGAADNWDAGINVNRLVANLCKTLRDEDIVEVATLWCAIRGEELNERDLRCRARAGRGKLRESCELLGIAQSCPNRYRCCATSKPNDEDVHPCNQLARWILDQGVGELLTEDERVTYRALREIHGSDVWPYGYFYISRSTLATQLGLVDVSMGHVLSRLANVGLIIYEPVELDLGLPEGCTTRITIVLPAPLYRRWK